MRLIRRILAALLLLVLGAMALVGGLLLMSLPAHEGTIFVQGLERAVTIDRDERGVPRISAGSESDAYFALGFVHAQDRLWQMEAQRRLGAGRLAELVGEAALNTDRFMRTLGLHRRAKASLDGLDEPVKKALDAYAAGVNAWIERAGWWALPPEFLLLRHRPEPWKPADSLVWGRLMAMQLAGNWREELLRMRLAETLPRDKVEALWPEEPNQPATVALETIDRLLAATPEALMPRLASNEWAVAGNRARGGKPLLANDPHLGLQAPILWYLAAVVTPTLRLSGATVPGSPFHVIAHNGGIAWGFTTTHADQMDLVVERDAGDGSYATPAGRHMFATREEVILVRDAEPVRLIVREGRHGPIISDVLKDTGAKDTALALQAAALIEDDRSAQALYKLNHAHDWDEFRAALRDFHAPMQNIAYADAEGHIGLTAPGRVPMRRAGAGQWPQPGWTEAGDWTGFVPFDELPQMLDPPSGQIVNANNRLVSDSYPHSIAAGWPEPHRARRILDLLGSRNGLTLDDMAGMQLDSVSPMALEIKPVLVGMAAAASERARDALAMIEAWDGTMDRDRPEPLIFSAWLRELNRAIFRDELGPLFPSFAQTRPALLLGILNGNGTWCDDVATQAAEECRQLVAVSLERALDWLSERFGAEPARWRWGDAHLARFDHQLFGRVPVLDRLTRLEIATSGGEFTINRGTYFPSDDEVPFEHSHGAGLRALFDLSNLDASRFVIATGQSGNPLSSHYRDQLEDWRDGRARPLAPSDAGTRQLILAPGR